MFSLSLITLGLATIGAYAKPTTRTPGGLEIYLSTPTNKVGSVADLRIVAIVKNAGNEDLKILKLGTVLDIESPTRPFIVSKDGKEVPFTGSTAPALDQSSEENWIVIHPGENATAEHDVSTLYDLSANGPGTFTFDPVSTFQVMGPDHTVKTNVADVYPISVSITDDVSKREPRSEEGQKVSCEGNPNKTALIMGAAFESWSLADTAGFYIDRGNDSALYKKYFGTNDQAKVRANFDKLAKAQNMSMMISCLDPHDECNTNPVGAYTADSNVHVCDSFYHQLHLDSVCEDEVVGPHHTRASTILGQVAQVLNIGGTDAVGCKQSRKLGDDKKIINADNYRCFALATYIKTLCPSHNVAY